MTLYKQLEIMLVALFVIMFAGTLLVNFQSTRSYLMEQLDSHAQDAATSLGLSLTHYLAEKDIPAMETMINAVFDHGYYKEITITDVHGNAQVERIRDLTIQGVPTWFTHLITLTTPRKTETVLSGWTQAGMVHVQSHPGYAYKELWRSSINMFIWFASIAIILSIVGLYALRALLKPLKSVEEQTEAICNKQYIIQENLPRTRELNTIVNAVNRMVERIKGMFEIQARNTQRLKELAYLDSVTGFYNRRHFEAQLKCGLIDSPDKNHQGALLILQLKDIEKINKSRGFEAGDALLKKTGQLIEKALIGIDQYTLGRIAGANFGILLPHTGAEEAEAIASKMCKSLPRLHTRQLTDSPDVGHVAIVMYEDGKDASELFSEADMTLRQATSKGFNTWARYETDNVPDIHRRHERMTRIANVIRTQNLILHAQPIASLNNSENILHTEFLLRIPATEGEKLWHAGMFIPIAEQVGLARELDHIVLSKILEYIANNGSTISKVAMNLSMTALEDPNFLNSLYTMLANVWNADTRLVFEATEFSVVNNLQQLREFVARLHDLGHGFGLDHFGRGFSDFGYLHSLHPDYIKIDSSFISRINDDEDSQFFVESLCDIAHHLDIQVIAMGVETQEQWDTLKHYKLDGIQGFAFKRPMPIEEAKTAGYI